MVTKKYKFRYLMNKQTMKKHNEGLSIKGKKKPQETL